MIEDSPNILRNGVDEIRLVQAVLDAVGNLGHVNGDVQDDADQVDDSGQ